MRSATVETIEVLAPPFTRLARWCSAAGMAAVVALALGGLILLAQGFYIHAKAMLAQILLERAFAQALTTGTPVKPWSWADTWPVARVAVPRLGKSAIVLAGASGQAARWPALPLSRHRRLGGALRPLRHRSLCVGSPAGAQHLLAAQCAHAG